MKEETNEKREEREGTENLEERESNRSFASASNDAIVPPLLLPETAEERRSELPVKAASAYLYGREDKIKGNLILLNGENLKNLVLCLSLSC